MDSHELDRLTKIANDVHRFVETFAVMVDRVFPPQDAPAPTPYHDQVVRDFLETPIKGDVPAKNPLGRVIDDVLAAHVRNTHVDSVSCYCGSVFTTVQAFRTHISNILVEKMRERGAQ